MCIPSIQLISIHHRPSNVLLALAALAALAAIVLLALAAIVLLALAALAVLASLAYLAANIQPEVTLAALAAEQPDIALIQRLATLSSYIGGAISKNIRSVTIGTFF